MLLLTFNPADASPLTDSPAVAKVSGPNHDTMVFVVIKVT